MWCGRVDVDAMLAEMTPEQLDEWMAAYRTGLLSDWWQMAGSVAAEVHNGFCDVRAGLNDKSITAESYRYPSDYDPARRDEKKRIKNDSPEAFGQRMAQRYG